MRVWRNVLMRPSSCSPNPAIASTRSSVSLTSSARVFGDFSTSSTASSCRDTRFPIPSGNFTFVLVIRRSSCFSRTILGGSSFRDVPHKSNVRRLCRFPICSRSSVASSPRSSRYLR
uniref:Uncharacterized protein n=1 Tax=Setaria italica TaxID=4555 RepID=K3ZN83_SETIT